MSSRSPRRCKEPKSDEVRNQHGRERPEPNCLEVLPRHVVVLRAVVVALPATAAAADAAAAAVVPLQPLLPQLPGLLGGQQLAVVPLPVEVEHKKGSRMPRGLKVRNLLAAVSAHNVRIARRIEWFAGTGESETRQFNCIVTEVNFLT